MEQIKTKRLVLTLAQPSDLPELEALEKECDAYFTFDPPSGAEHNRSLRECLTIGDIIPGISDKDYKRENYHLYCVRKNDALVGWVSFYLEYHAKDAVYLSVAYIKEEARASGIGAEIMQVLECEFVAAGFKTMKTHCSLRNALSLKFLMKHGIDRIMDVECDGNLLPENFGGVELMKTL